MNAPTLATVKALFARSRNRCAFPDCSAPVVEDTGTVTAEICHVRALSPRGPRYDETQTAEERNAAANLVLMCGRHHKIIDTETGKYTSAALLAIKRDHEEQGIAEISREGEIDHHPFTLELRRRLADLRRPRLLATPASEWAARYIGAATAFHDANSRIRQGWRTHAGTGAKHPLLGQDSEPWLQLMEAAEALSAHALPGAADWTMLSDVGLVPRILSIQLNRGVGYAVDTGYQVLDAIMQSGPENKRWDTLYSIAVKAYGLEAHFTPKQAGKYGRWRQNLVDKVTDRDPGYLRPPSFDAVLCVLFPGMARGISNGYGRAVEES